MQLSICVRNVKDMNIYYEGFYFELTRGLRPCNRKAMRNQTGVRAL